MAFLNLYPLLVETIFGSILLAGIGLMIFFVVIGMLTRMSQMLIITILFAFIIAYGIGYVGAIIAIPAFVFAATYLGYNIIKVFYPGM